MSPDRARALLNAPLGPLYHLTPDEEAWVASQLPWSSPPDRTFHDLLREVAGITVTATPKRKLKKAA